MKIDLSYSDLKTIIYAIKYRYQHSEMHDFEAMDLVELEFRLSSNILEAYKESKFKPLTEEEIKKLEDKFVGVSLWKQQKDSGDK